MEWKLDSYDRLTLQQLNTAQLQVIVNDQLNQIEGQTFFAGFEAYFSAYFML